MRGTIVQLSHKIILKYLPTYSIEYFLYQCCTVFRARAIFPYIFNLIESFFCS